MRPLFVLEVNEVPVRVLRWYAQQHPHSAVATLLDRSAVGESVVDEELPRDAYPSQTWASLAMGVPFEQHGVFWYGDPKPQGLPLYWQAAAAAGVTTGVVGPLHSSPLQQQCSDPHIKFAVPDAFAGTSDAKPDRLSSLQEFNLSMTRANGRVVSDTSPMKKYLGAVPAIVRNGLGGGTAVQLASLATDVARGAVPKERLRVGQFQLMADQFTRLVDRYDPRLSVLFTNHVASVMHRYWFTMFPEDWDREIYDRDWVDRNKEEIPFALDILDRWLARWMTWAEQSGRTLLILSSMGQTGGADVDTSQDSAVVVESPERFAAALGITSSFTIGSAMVPQVSYQFDTEKEAISAACAVGAVSVAGKSLHVDRSDRAITVSYSALNGVSDSIEIGSSVVPLSEMGLKAVEVTEHRAGVHDPAGSIIAFNSPTASIPEGAVDYLTIAPAILRSLGVEPLAHHRESELVF
jgi:hypothetical protein